jgi:DNA-binding transcriptional regulator YiaG
MSQKRFAAELGVSQESVSQWEAGAWRPSDEHAAAIDRLYGEITGTLIGG